MKRKVPPTPQLRERELDRTLDLVDAPRLPEGLAARITANVTRLPQDAPASAPIVGPRPVAARAIAPEPVRSSMMGRASRRWVGAGAGFAALAAGLAVFALVGAPRVDDPAAPVPTMPPAAPALAADLASAPAPSGPAVAQPAQLAANGQAAPRAAVHVPAAPAAAIVTDAAPVPEPAALAVALPPAVEGPIAAPAADDAAPMPGARGQMGPAVPQGFGYTGGAPGSLPSSAPVTMSGGPGMGSGGMGSGGMGGGPKGGGPGPRR